MAMLSGLLMLQSITKTVSAPEAEVTSDYSEEWSACRQAGSRRRLCPASRLLSYSNDLCHTAAAEAQQRHSKLLQKTTRDREEADEGLASASESKQAATSGFDRGANVSVHFSSTPAAASKLGAEKKISGGNTMSCGRDSVTSDKNNLLTTFNVLPDSLVTHVFSRGLDSCDLYRCSLVCRRWNALVWTDSRLWTTIDFGYHETLDVDRALLAVTRAVSDRTRRLCVGVQQVLVDHCRRLTDAGLQTLARRCINLRRLDVSCCTFITNTGVFDVLSRCVNLQHLNTTGLYPPCIYFT